MESVSQITENELTSLRAAIDSMLSPARVAHTLSVECEAAKIAELLLPDKVVALRAAALLHDLTKELPLAEHQRICHAQKERYSNEAFASAAVLHGFSAAQVIRERFPLFATSEILSAVEKHTVGHPDMSVFDKILFLADYIEPTRPYPSCNSLRESFWSKILEAKADEQILVLDFAVFAEVKQTLHHLLQKSVVVAPESLALYNAYAARKDLQG